MVDCIHHKNPFGVSNKILLLRLFRLGRIPSALNGGQILAEKGFPVIGLEFGNLFEEEEQVVESFPRLRWASPWAVWVPRFLRPLAIFLGILIRLSSKINDEGRPQLVLAHGIQEQAMAWILRGIFGIRYGVHVHEVFERKDLSIGNWMFLAMERYALRGAEFLIFPESERYRLYQARYQLKNRTFIAFNCPRKRKKPALGSTRRELGLSASSKLLIYVGGIGENNALSNAVKALSLVRNTYLVLVGWNNPGEVERLREVAHSAGVSERVLFKGVVEDEEKWRLLAAADASYCIYEPRTIRLKHLATASNKFMESACAGLPILSSSNEDFRKLVEGQDLGICVKDIEVPSLAAGFRALFRDELRLKRWSQNARRKHEQVWNYEAQFAPIAEFCEQHFSKRAGDTVPPLLRVTQSGVSA